jgi:hypothetical protein
MAGPLSAERPGPDAYTTRSEGTWDEISKGAIGVYRGRSLTRDEGQARPDGHVGVKTPKSSAMGQPPPGISNLRSKAIMGKPFRRKRR